VSSLARFEAVGYEPGRTSLLAHKIYGFDDLSILIPESGKSCGRNRAYSLSLPPHSRFKPGARKLRAISRECDLPRTSPGWVWNLQRACARARHSWWESDA